jgi:nitrate/nitrite transporter NarK
MLVGACFLSSAILTPIVPTAGVAIAVTCFVMFGNAVWVANVFSLPADLFEANEVGTVTGFSGAGGSLSGIFAMLGTGYVVTRFSYHPVFVLAGLMPPMTIALVYWLLPDRAFQNARGVQVSLNSNKGS